MAKKTKSGEVSKSEELRQLFKQNPEIKVSEAIATLAQKGIKVDKSMFYYAKGHMKGRKGRRKQIRRQVAGVIATSNGAATSGYIGSATSGDVLATIKKVKSLAAEVGGLRKLKALVEALSE